MTMNTDQSLNSAERLPASRSTPAGRAGADGYAWAGRLAAAALAMALLWFIYAVVRPLPSPPAAEAQRVPRAPVAPERTQPIDVRENRLDALVSANYFNHEREFWAPDAGETEALAEAQRLEQAAEEQAAEAERLASRQRTIDPNEPMAFDSIPITDRSSAPVSLLQRVQEVQLRGVYRGEGDPVAMIDLMTEREPRNRMRRLRIGQRFDEDNWRLIAIDDVTDRIILSRAGYNFMISLYDSPFGRDGSLAQASDAAHEAESPGKSEEEVRSELADAGLEQSEIDNLLALALGDDALEGEAAKADEAPADEARATETPEAESQQTRPPGVATILRLLSGNPLQGGDADNGGPDGE
ncbi:MAG: hypothetical protein EA376_08595 [Phycisphaeraceae bacterium]|nr:MAG: hypothetical protein EA376_08595 [Phycisphaeraceae bacterium]